MRPLLPGQNKKAQATTELAVMGAILIMVLAYLLQQGVIYNARQALEMYTFRKALQLSKDQEKGISLTVIRDIIPPSFFTGLNRQRLMASASVNYNPFILYTPFKEDPEDVPTRQLLQINEAMIRNGYFFEIPPTMVKVHSTDPDAPSAEWTWTASTLREIDPQTEQVRRTQRTSHYDYLTAISEDGQVKRVTKELQSQDRIPTEITFEDEGTIKENYGEEDWEDEIADVEIAVDTLPKRINLILEETVRREKSVQTPR